MNMIFITTNLFIITFTSKTKLCVRYTDYAARFGVSGFPTLVLFENGRPKGVHTVRLRVCGDPTLGWAPLPASPFNRAFRCAFRCQRPWSRAA